MSGLIVQPSAVEVLSLGQGHARKLMDTTKDVVDQLLKVENVTQTDA